MSPDMRTTIDRLKAILREYDIPFFTDEELQFYLAENNGDFKRTVYECLIIKSEDTSMKTNELFLGDSSKYFRRLASRYRPTNSGILKG